MVEVSPPANSTTSRSMTAIKVAGVVLVLLSLVGMVYNRGGGVEGNGDDAGDDNSNEPLAAPLSSGGAQVKTKKSGGSSRAKRYASTNTDGQIVEGNHDDAVLYYHCSATRGISPLDVHDIVLLHGSKFTREDWKTSGILEHLCRYNHVNVLALDLPVGAQYDELLPVLQGLAQRKIITKLPVPALVTPSASGVSVVSALAKNDMASVAIMTSLWVPIASGSIDKLQPSQLEPIRNKRDLNIWAIYGNQDATGKEVSLKLQKEAGASIKEFPGGHSFYLDIPDQFTQALAERLGVPNRRRMLRRG